ncbi:MAG: family 78 glycoside hydrolase catalytic domain, partial [Oscillospiraceae bacterium]|nr:family 78 glycoside hydrolase catalytic domain [Oscillospiraceae bacterium]
TAYQIVVATDPALAGGVVWNSDKVSGDESVNVYYAGAPLATRTRYHWQVTVWNDRGDTAASEITWFETGLTDADFTADFIAVDRIEPVLPNPTAYEISVDFRIDEAGAGFVFAGAGNNYLMWQVSTMHAENAVYLRPHKWAPGGQVLPASGATLYEGASFVGDSGQIDVTSALPLSARGDWNTLRLVVTSPGTQASTGTVDTYINGVKVARHTGLITQYGRVGFREVAKDLSQPGYERASFDNISLAEVGDDGLTTLFEEDFSGGVGVFTDNTISVKNDGDGRGNYAYCAGSGTATQTPAVPLAQTAAIGNSLPMFRTEFETLPGRDVKSARLYATAFGLYDASINGHLVAPDEMFNPGWTDYRTALMYQTYDVTGLLRSGVNAIGAETGSGWFAGHVSYGDGSNNLYKYGRYPAFLGQLEITYEDGVVQTVKTDSSWKVYTDGPVTFADNQDGETYDARKEIPGWNLVGFDDSRWPGAAAVTSANAAVLLGRSRSGNQSGFSDVAVDVDHVALFAHIGPRIRLGEEVSSDVESLLGKDIRDVSIVGTFPDGDKTRYILDCGQNIAGVAQITVRGGQAGDTVRLRFAEMLHDGRQGAAGELAREALRSAQATDYYTKKGDGDETFTPRFTWHGFRYIEIQGYPGELDPADVKVYFVGSDIPLTGVVNSSSADLNQFYSNVMWSMRDNFLSVPTDCPQRDERLGWTGDAEVFSRTAAYNRDTDQFYKKFIADMAARQRPDGGVWDYNPDEGHDHNFGNAAWADAATVIPWNVYLMYGDTKILEDAYTLMQGHVYYYTMAAAARTESDSAWSQNATYAAFDRDNPQQPEITDLGTTVDDRKYILGGCAYGDWLAPSGTPNQVTATAYFAHSAELLSKAAAVLGKSEDAAYYKALSDRVKLSFQRRFYEASTGALTGNSQTAYLLAIEFGLLPESEWDKLTDRLLGLIEGAGDHLTTGFVGAALLLPALSNTGNPEEAYNLLLGVDTYPSWLYSIRQGATTTWERWDAWTVENGFQSTGMNSFNHYSFGAALEWVYRYAAGIEADESAPGFKRFVLQPTPNSRLTFLNTSFDSAYGRIVSDWTYDGPTGAFDYTAKVPGNTAATV